APSSPVLGLGNCLLADPVSAKIERTSKVQFGQIAGAGESLRAHKMPATKVPCIQAALLALVQVPRIFPVTSRIFWSARSGWFVATGPSINPIMVSLIPLVISINPVSFTISKGFMMLILTNSKPLPHDRDLVALP